MSLMTISFIIDTTSLSGSTLLLEETWKSFIAIKNLEIEVMQVHATLVSSPSVYC